MCNTAESPNNHLHDNHVFYHDIFVNVDIKCDVSVNDERIHGGKPGHNRECCRFIDPVNPAESVIEHRPVYFFLFL